MKRDTRVAVFTSFDEENQVEIRRRAAMSPEERLEEFAALQERLWGELWTSVPMARVATWERLAWADPA